MMPCWLAALAAAVSLGAAPRDRAPREALDQGVAFLMAAQAEDGGWHSETYGTMRQGAALTAHVLYALSSVPAARRAALSKRLAAGYAFLQQGIAKRGHVANPDGTDDYPTYSTALLLVAARQLPLEMPDDEKKRLVEFLIAAQLDETREFQPGDPHFGGWDFSGAQHVIGQTSGTNVSVTCCALEALSAAEHAKLPVVLSRAAKWLGGCQNVPGDGGFFFTPDVDAPGNKAETVRTKDDASPPRARSYGSATCDGLRCLHYVATKPMNARVAAAVQWIADHPQIDVVPGFDELPAANGWKQGLRFYYYASLAKVLPDLAEPKARARRAQLLRHLVALQNADGSWRNPSNRMREDDPLICTAFAVTALGELLRHEAADQNEKP